MKWYLSWVIAGNKYGSLIFSYYRLPFNADTLLQSFEKSNGAPDYGWPTLSPVCVLVGPVQTI